MNALTIALGWSALLVVVLVFNYSASKLNARYDASTPQS